MAGGTPPPHFCNSNASSPRGPQDVEATLDGQPLNFRRFECTFCEFFIANKRLRASPSPAAFGFSPAGGGAGCVRENNRRAVLLWNQRLKGGAGELRKL